MGQAHDPIILVPEVVGLRSESPTEHDVQEPAALLLKHVIQVC